jgi:hypothetical protein
LGAGHLAARKVEGKYKDPNRSSPDNPTEICLFWKNNFAVSEKISWEIQRIYLSDIDIIADAINQ